MADNIDVTQGSGKTIAADEIASVLHQRVKVQHGADGSATDVSTSSPLPVLVGTTDTVTVKLDPSAGLIGISGTVQVKTDPSSVLSSITSSIGIYFDRGGPAITITDSNGGIADVSAINADGISDAVVALGTKGYNYAFNGSTWDRVKGNTGGIFVNSGSTASIFTVSGSTSTAGNNTLVSPSASYNFKVYAYSIQTTGVVSIAPRFTTGASAGATELWRPLITAAASSSSPVGANLAITPPGFIFATGTNTTLALYLDAATLVHYSVSFIKESA